METKNTKLNLMTNEHLCESMLGWKSEQSRAESLLNPGEERGGKVVRRTCWIDWGLEGVSALSMSTAKRLPKVLLKDEYHNFNLGGVVGRQSDFYGGHSWKVL